MSNFNAYGPLRAFLKALTIALLLLLLLAHTSLGQQSVRRIKFRRGAISATVAGHLYNIHDTARFILRAKSGQHMRVTISGAGPTRGMVAFPDGGGEGSPGGTVYDDVLPLTGDYVITVSESTMANEWRGSFTVKVEIE